MERLFLTREADLALDSDLASARVLDVRADDTDARDYIFQPKLDLLPADLPPPWKREVLDQGGEGACVGYALATVINTSLIRRSDPNLELPRDWGEGAVSGLSREELVSQRMLYEMGRRHDEWQGDQYEGTSLRGAMKGWHKHGVCSRRHWSCKPGAPPGLLDDAGREDARRRPLGAYYRILDSDVLHVQAAIHEGDAVLASVWVHCGWRQEQLAAAEQFHGLPRIPSRRTGARLHAVALVGYEANGFVVQNSWGEGWGLKGRAILGYDDWFRNRQDAWVARPGTETLDEDRKPRIFLVDFEGGTAGASGMAGTAGADGLGIEPDALAHIVNTGDRGALSGSGRLRTPADDLPAMAARVRLTPVANGARHVVLYAHGGLVSETRAARRAAQLHRACAGHRSTGYFFVWETGKLESFFGLLRSRDDERGARAGFDFGSVAGRVAKKVRDRVRKAQMQIGAAVASAARPGWNEMKRRAEGAARRNGGARRFAEQLVAAMEDEGSRAGGKPFKLHLVAHSAGSIYLAHLYDAYLREVFAREEGKVRLGSVRFFAPAITLDLFEKIFVSPEGKLPTDRFEIHVLSDQQESADSIGVYPSSLLTYVRDHLESRRQKVPVTGIHSDLRRRLARVGAPTVVQATVSERHGHFDDPGGEVEAALAGIAEA